jgi:hypothetical protein
VKAVLPELFDQLVPYLTANGSGVEESVQTEGDDWDWNEGSGSPTGSKVPSSNSHDFQLQEAKSIIETYVENLMGPLKVTFRVAAGARV